MSSAQIQEEEQYIPSLKRKSSKECVVISVLHTIFTEEHPIMAAYVYLKVNHFA